jgi:hemoglobin
MKALKILLSVGVVALLSACSSMSSVNPTSLYSQLGGKEAISKLSGNLLSGATSDPRLTSLLGKVDVGAATPKLNDQLCAALGGGCKAAFSPDQISAAAKKLNPSQASALQEVFNSSLGKSGVSSALQGPMKEALGSQLNGIVGSLL